MRGAFCAVVLLLAQPNASAQSVNLSTPAGSGAFGTTVTVLANGNYVVTDPSYDDGTTVDVGAVYLYNGKTHVVISTLKGSTANDKIGTSVKALANGNFVITSPSWHNGALANAGAATLGNGTTGVGGILSAANSLVGGGADNKVGSGGVFALDNGNYVILSPEWDNSSNTDAGAVTWGNGSSGISGVVSSGNSLVGGTSNNKVGGQGITGLTNGNYVVISSEWDNGSNTDAGAVTWGNAATGVSGVVSAANSLVGSSSNDRLGSSGVTVLANGNFVVVSPQWDNGSATDAGAATWGNGSTGLSGTVSAANSFVGSNTADQVGLDGVKALTNGNYVVSSSYWNASAGAVSWGNGITGSSGVVSVANSLISSNPDSYVGSVVTPLTNGNYVVGSPAWDGNDYDIGAATWCNGATGLSGIVSDANSLVGSSGSDYVGLVVTALTNGNYVVGSQYVNGNKGAATWANGNTGITGQITSSNSLIGESVDDAVGTTITALTNGNYVVTSPGWSVPGQSNSNAYGATTFGNGTTGMTGVISYWNSLVGDQAVDQVGFGGVTALANGNYVVYSPFHANSGGAFSWCNGTVGTVRSVAANNPISTQAGNYYAPRYVTALTNGNYVLSRPGYPSANGSAAFVDGTTGFGSFDPSASFVGTAFGDRISQTGIFPLQNGNYIIVSPGSLNQGIITLGDGAYRLSGNPSSCNSVYGSTGNGASSIVYDYNYTNSYLLVGRPADNLVTIFAPAGQTMPTTTETGSVTITGSASTPIVNYATCKVIAVLRPSGALPVSGVVDSKEWIAGAPITGTVSGATKTFAARHYEITPAANASTATGTVTLYFKQAEFDLFNSDPGATDHLPTGSSDAQGIANLRIYKYSGTSNDGSTGLPATYTNGVSIIDPADGSIIWNTLLSRWEVSFSVTGFSGFFVGGEPSVPLPVSLLSFTGKREGSLNKLTWTTASEMNNRGFSLERSLDGNHYSAIAFIASKASGGSSNSTLNYSFNDNTTAARAYYRLVQTDFDGRIKTSAIVLLRNGTTDALAITSLYPNPASTSVRLSLENAAGGIVTLFVTDMHGRIVLTDKRALFNGANAIQLDIAGLSPGTYSVKAANANGDMVYATFVKL